MLTDDYGELRVYAPIPERVDRELYDALVKQVNNPGLTVPKDMSSAESRRIMTINGNRSSVWFAFQICNFCSGGCDREAKVCRRCNKHMCALCFSETSEEIALKNGAENYHKRKDALAECRAHGLESIETVLINTCDECGENIPLTQDWYDLTQEPSPHCLACYDSLGSAPIKRLMTRRQNDMGFGSVRDWFVIASDNHGNAILCNLNIDSPWYKYLGFRCVDGHGRVGYFRIDDQKELSALLKEYDETKLFKEKTCPNFDPNIHDSYEGLDGNVDINCKIALMMLKRHMITYYG